MDTRVSHITKVSATRGLPASIADPIRPEWFACRSEAQIGKALGLTQFGVNQVTLEPGSVSSLRHWHEGEDEFVYVLSGEVTLIDENGEHPLTAGAFAGFPAGVANAHHLANRSTADAVLLVVGTRKVGEERIHYPDDLAEPSIVTRDASGNRISR